ncbi:MAG: thermonuclease family protein [Planctomycetota bacterium]
MPRRPRRTRTRLRRPAEWLAARRARRRLVFGAIAIAVALLIGVDRAGWLLVPTADRARYHLRSVTVVNVIDGDTLDVDLPDAPHATTRIRLWGVDTPERGDPATQTPPEPGYQQATDATRDWALHQTVTLELEPHSTRGRYGRLLAYVRLPDGDLLNERLLDRGLAHADPRFAHSLADRFDLLEAGARKRRIGLWAR